MGTKVTANCSISAHPGVAFHGDSVAGFCDYTPMLLAALSCE